VRLHGIAGGDPRDNAAALTALLDGAPGPYRTAVQWSGAAALLVAGDGEMDDLPAYAERIGRALDDGSAKATLASLVARSHHEASMMGGQ
jgi:anthranilate phosphoribosyltransferase